LKTATVSEIKKELKQRSPEEIMELCLRLSRFKKENKELLTYLLFESEQEESYVKELKKAIDEQFENVNTKNFYLIKKSIRRILREVKKYIRYSPKKETEVELLIYFCGKLKNFKPSIKKNKTMVNLYERQILFIEKKIALLHEDLQYDYSLEIEDLTL